MDLYDHINDGFSPPGDNRWLSAFQSGTLSYFELGNIPADHTITAITFRSRILLALGLGAGWWGWKWTIRKDSTALITNEIAPGTQMSPVTYESPKTGLSIDSNDFNAARGELLAQGQGWGFYQAIIQYSEFELTLTHAPTLNPVYPIEVLSPINDPIVDSPIEDPNALSPMADPVVGSPIEDPHVLSPIKEKQT